MADASTSRFRLIELAAKGPFDAFARDVAEGLGASPKRLSCRYFYDREGSRLFEAICDAPEYYLTRAETEILRDRSREIAAGFAEAATVVELGSGSAVKTRLLLDALSRGTRRVRYVPIDICRPVLEESAAGLLQLFPKLDIVAVAAEYHDGLRLLRTESANPKLILWLGSNIGNFDRPEAAAFLRRLRDSMNAPDRLLVGIDLRKDKAVLEAAYDDAAGATAAFNRNLLARINRELDADFDLDAFRHRAEYDVHLGRIEMYLVSTRAQRVAIRGLELEVSFAAGEAIHTENSYKYSLSEIAETASAAGLRAERCWRDAARRFSLNMFQVAGAPRQR